MTQPVQEPGSVTRTDAKLTWGSNQLFRRPSPVSSEGGLNPWVVLDGWSTTAPHNTWMPYPNQEIIYNPALVTQGDIFDWTITDVGDPGNDRFELETKVSGWYEWELVTYWDQVTTGGSEDWGAATQRIDFNPGTGFGLSDNDLRNSADWPDVDVHNFFEMVDNPWLRGGGKLFVPANCSWLPTMKQTTGVDRGLSGEKFQVWFLGADAVADWTFETV